MLSKALPSKTMLSKTSMQTMPSTMPSSMPSTPKASPVPMRAKVTGMPLSSSSSRPAAAADLPVSLAALSERLLELHNDLARIITLYKPTSAAIEETFVTQNGASTLKLGQARGALIVTLAANNLPVAEYATRLVKKAIVGTGTADKNQMGQMVGVLLPAARSALAACKHDAADALAIAICHAHQAKW